MYLNDSLKVKAINSNIGAPRYSRGLCSWKVLRIPKPRITREHCYGKKLFICTNLYKNPRIIEDNPADNKFYHIKMNPRIIKTANSKPANNERSLYLLRPEKKVHLVFSNLVKSNYGKRQSHGNGKY